jgi:ABC-type uncharacterized transport system ATPase subunit
MKIELKNIHKHYGPVKANDSISFSVSPGTIHGVLGENGAGKSTLMKLLVGFIQKTSGEILINNDEVDILSPAQAVHMGIGMLYQDPMDFQRLTVIENFMLKKEGSFFVSKKDALKVFTELSGHLGFVLNPNLQLQRLTIGERQQLELIRLLMMDVKVLILDEPTTGISDIQKKSLFSALEKMAKDGRSVILVSHKLEDVERLCSHVTVLRHGRVNGEMERPFDKEKLLTMMFGTPPLSSTRVALNPGKTILDMDRVSMSGGRTGLRDCTAHIKQSEIIGLAGLEGSGQSLFLRCAAGLIKPSKGTVRLNDRNMKGRNYHAFNHDGVTFLPTDRLEEGLIRGLQINEHFALKTGTSQFLIPRQQALVHSYTQIKKYQIKGTPASYVESLSGGNQQRLLLSMLPENPQLLLLENPTRGLDIESAHWVWKQLQELCMFKTSIIFSSSDLDEILEVSDRIFVFFDGRMVEQFSSVATSMDELGRAVSGLT